MTTYLIAGAASLVALPALAQVAPLQDPQAHRAPMAAKVHTRAEVQAKVAEHFARMDANRDGFVTKAEAEAGRKAMRGMMKKKMAERIKLRTSNPGEAFDRLDTDRNGVLSRDEFARGAELRQERRVVRLHSGGGSGFHGMAGMHRMGGQMFEMADANRDGRLTLAETTAAALRRFDMADVNRDGRLTPDERMQIRQKMRAERQRG